MVLPSFCLLYATCCAFSCCVLTDWSFKGGTKVTGAVTQKQDYLCLSDHWASWSYFESPKGGTKVAALCKGGFSKHADTVSLRTLQLTFTGYIQAWDRPMHFHHSDVKKSAVFQLFAQPLVRAKKTEISKARHYWPQKGSVMQKGLPCQNVTLLRTGRIKYISGSHPNNWALDHHVLKYNMGPSGKKTTKYDLPINHRQMDYFFFHFPHYIFADDIWNSRLCQRYHWMPRSVPITVNAATTHNRFTAR